MNLKMMFTQAISKDFLAATILWVLAINQRPMGIDELCTWTASGDDKVRSSIKALEALEVIYVECRERGAKYVSLASGCQEFLPGFAPALGVAASLPKYSESGKPETDVIDLVAEPIDAISESGKPEAEIGAPAENGQKTAKKGNFSPENASESGKPESETGSINQSIDDDEFNINLKKSSSSILNPKTKKEFVSEIRQVTVFDAPQDFPSLDAVLSAMEMLFGDYLTADMFPPGTSPKLALAWVCKAYFDFTSNPKFKNPVGMVRKRLAAKEPRKITRLEDMPEDFLDALGLWKGRCDLCGRGFRSRSALREHLATEQHFDDDADTDADEPLDNSASQTEIKARIVDIAIFPEWQSVLSAMQERMPRASFDTWVRDTAPSAWDQDARRLQIGVRNTYARDWLETRVKEACAKLVGEIVGGPVEIEFVVAAF